MSENIPKSTTTSTDSKTHRPLKRARGVDTAISAQASAVERLFEKNPDIQIPKSATKPARTTADLPPPPEIVQNVQGSSAGAGSGEFHVYKASRRREYDRIRLMEEEAKREEDEKAWKEKQERNKEKDEGKTSKNRKRREKQKQKKDQAKKGPAEGDPNNGDGKTGKLKPMELKIPDEGDEDADMAEDDRDAETKTEGDGLVIHDDD